jgi:tetratricopeptide (TPR) repeat protein
MKGFSTREVAEVLDLPTSTIQSWTRSGLLTPERGSKGAYVFSFQDIVLLRAARELLDGDVPARRVKTALASLRAQLPVGRPLSAVHISAMGDHVVVRDADTVWEPDSGQIQLDFAVSEVAERGAPVARRSLERVADARDDGPSSADDWYDTAVDLEAVDAVQAVQAYRRALALDPHHADAQLNLGRLLHESGDLDGAEERYRAATAADPESARARYNLGVLLEDRSQTGGAIAAYRDAIAVDRFFAVAHFNLSRLLQATGRRPEAIRHLTEYRRLMERGDASG